MIRRLREKQSALAVWASRLAMLSLPVLVIAGIGMRSERLDGATTYAVIAAGFALAFLALIFAIAALAAIWRDGRRGTGPAVAGLLIAVAVLAVPAVGAYRVMTAPRLTDISTSLEDPPPFRGLVAFHGPESRRIVPYSDAEIEAQREGYPDIVSRHYAIGPARVFDDARTLVGDRGWVVKVEHRPDETDDTGYIEAIASTPIFGFRQDVAIRIEPDGEGALVDMRSAARDGAHDLGANASRIRDFFRDLDTALQGITE